MKRLQPLKDGIDKGFYVDNLDSMASLCRSLALDTETPAIFFVIERIFRMIAEDWRDKPIDVDEAKYIEVKVAEPLNDLVNALEANCGDSELLLLTNKLVSAYLSCMKT